MCEVRPRSIQMRDLVLKTKATALCVCVCVSWCRRGLTTGGWWGFQAGAVENTAANKPLHFTEEGHRCHKWLDMMRLHSTLNHPFRGKLTGGQNRGAPSDELQSSVLAHGVLTYHQNTHLNGQKQTRSALTVSMSSILVFDSLMTSQDGGEYSTMMARSGQ